MALDRQTIEKKDFPISRRGYDVDAVDTHLRLLAEEVEELKRSSRRRPESLASVAAEEVQAIVAAAETAASRIQGDAENEADEIRRQARVESKNTREEATAQAAQYVSNVSDATSSLLARVESIDRELASVVDLLRSAGGRVQGELDELQGNLDEVKDAVSFRARSAPAPPGEADMGPPPPPPAPEALEPLEPEVEEFDEELADPDLVESPTEPAYEEELEDAEEYEVPLAATVVEDSIAETAEGEPATEAQSPDEDARLIALNMALNGAPRDEVDRYLAENFELQDRGSLIDEVYAAIDN